METDHTLLAAARTMDQEALIKIFDRYASPVFNYALRICGDPVLADHIVGDVFAKLLDQLAAGNGPKSNLRSYLFEMAYHQLIDEARYSRRRAPLEVALSLRGDTHSGLLILEDQVLFKDILYAIWNDLTDDQRHVVVLRFLEGFNIQETAAVMRKKVSHVKVIQSRAIAALRKSLEKNGNKNFVSSSKMRSLPKPVGV